MKIAVTGATGFIGGHVLAELSNRSDVEFLAVVRPGRAHLIGSNIPVVELDITAPSSTDFVALGRPDVLLHLAWGGLPRYQSLHHFEVELPLQFAFLRNLVAEGLGSLVVSGTCYEYGMRCGEMRESLLPRPANPYAYAKNALREQLEYLRTKFDFELTWARLFYMYGRGQPQASLYGQLMSAIDRGDSAFPMSGGEQLRDYLPVENVARYLVELALRQQGAEIVNICSGVPVSVRTLVERIIELNGAQISLELGKYAYPVHEPMAFWGAADKLSSLMRDSATVP